MIDSEKVGQIAVLFEQAELVMVLHGDKKIALGRDIQEEVVKALKVAIEVMKKEERDG